MTTRTNVSTGHPGGGRILQKIGRPVMAEVRGLPYSSLVMPICNFLRLGLLFPLLLGPTLAHGQAAYDFGTEPMRYIENGRLKLGINLKVGGAVTFLEDKKLGGGNMINSFDWGRQVQLSYYSGPVPYIGPNGEKPRTGWEEIGWNPIQAGSIARIPSKTISFESGSGFLRVRCIPMQWPLENVPGDCVFEVTYRLLADNAVVMEARLLNHRTDRTQYPAREQEMPALYTNGPWYRLVAYLGDKPFTDAPLTTIVGKEEIKGYPMPWAKFYAPEHWSALINDQGHGVGMFQPETCSFAGGFAGGNDLKGTGGPADGQTGYLGPLAKRILDHNIDTTYRTHLIVGSLDEIRSHAKSQPILPPTWTFDSDRQGWIYENANDSGWPVHDGLRITFKKSPRGAMISDQMFWSAENAPALEVEAAFEAPDRTPLIAEVVIQPFGPDNTTDFPAWENPDLKEATERKRQTFPPAKPVVVPFEVLPDGGMRVYRVPLAGAEGYTGGMTRLSLRFPGVDGQVNVKRVSLIR